MSKLFDNPLPFVTEESEKSKNKTYKYLSRGLGFLFNNDQRNIVYFAVGLGVPAVLISFVGLYATAWGHPVLIAFSIFITLFVVWVVYSLIKLLK